MKNFVCGVEGNPSSFCIALNTTYRKCDKFGKKPRLSKTFGRDSSIYGFIPCKRCKTPVN